MTQPHGSKAPVVSHRHTTSPAIGVVIPVLLSALIAWPLTLSAQTLAEQTREAPSCGGTPSRVISVNPFLPLFGYFAGEFEHQFAPSVSWSAAGSHHEAFDAKATNIDAKIRLYPSQQGLRGFNIASSLGFARLRGEGECPPDPLIDAACPPGKPFSTPSFAIELGYQWLLGPSRVTAVSLGGGAKRYLGSDSKFVKYSGLRVVPTLRLNVGYAF